MAMGKRTVNSLGVLGVVLVLGGAYFGVAAPLIAERNSVQIELDQAQQLGLSYETKLKNFQSGENDTTRQATETMELFDSLVPDSIDIESASRAIATSLPAGVTLTSFTFGATQQVASVTGTPLTLTGFTPPENFGITDTTTTTTPPVEPDPAAVADGSEETPVAEGAQGTDPNAATSGFNRIPFTIQVSAGSYPELSEYLNSLAEQPRLMSVVSVDSSRPDTVTATIYAYAYSGQ